MMPNDPSPKSLNERVMAAGDTDIPPSASHLSTVKTMISDDERVLVISEYSKWQRSAALIQVGLVLGLVAPLGIVKLLFDPPRPLSDIVMLTWFGVMFLVLLLTGNYRRRRQYGPRIAIASGDTLTVINWLSKQLLTECDVENAGSHRSWCTFYAARLSQALEAREPEIYAAGGEVPLAIVRAALSAAKPGYGRDEISRAFRYFVELNL